MRTDALLVLSQWCAQAYPLGSFAYSHGLETAIADGRIASAGDLGCWLEGVLAHGTGRCDAVLIHAAHGTTPAQAAAIDAQARAYAPCAERLMETVNQGDAFCRTTSAIWPLVLEGLSHPVAYGHAAGQMGLPAPLAATLYLQAFASNLVSCAVRLVPLGQTEGQQVLADLAPLCAQIGQQTEGAALGDLAGSAFAAEIAAMRHETLEHRVFRT